MRRQNNYFDLLKELVKTDFKLRYKNSVLGLVWVLLKPFLSFLILFIIFGYLFGKSDPNYRLNLLIGLILFQFVNEATTRGMSSLIDRESIILKVNFPRAIAVMAPIINAVVNFGFSLLIFIVFWAFSPTDLTIWWLMIPIYIFIVFAIILGFSLMTSVIYVKIRDLGTIWEVLTTLLFYATPIIYPLALLPGKFQSYILLNPIASLVRDVRLIVIQGQEPGWRTFVYLLVLAVVLLLFGWLYFQKNIKKVAESF